VAHQLYVLGISAFYHDSAAALVDDGKIVAAVQEERFTRQKHDTSYPIHAIESCLQHAGIGLGDVSNVVFYDKPFLKFERLLETYLAFAPKGFKSFNAAMPLWIKEKLFQKALLHKKLAQMEPGFDWKDKLLFSEHHLSHAASAFYPSPFESAAILTMDGVGEWATTSLGFGEGKDLQMKREIVFPHSVGMLYSAFTYWTGFRVNSGEYKLMGLAPYGEPKYVDVIRQHLIDIKEDGSFRLDLSYFDYCTGLKMTNERFDSLLGAPRRSPEEPISKLHMDVAASIQVVVEEVVLRMTRDLAHDSGVRNLCLAGGVALNCVANGKILREGLFENIWVQPAAGDAGGALGAALAAYHLLLDGSRREVQSTDAMEGSYLGPSFADADVEHRLHSIGGRFERLSDSES
jgi:carbamoyltransferase